MEATTAPGHLIKVWQDPTASQPDTWFGSLVCVCGWKRIATGRQDQPWMVPQPIGVVTVLEARWAEHRQQGHANEPDPNLVES